MALLNSLYSRSKERISLPLLSCWPKYKKALFALSVAVAASVAAAVSVVARGRCLCRSWLAVLLLLLLLRADFEWGRLRLNSTRRNANATRRARRDEATRRGVMKNIWTASVRHQFVGKSQTRRPQKSARKQRKLKENSKD